ncbi:FxSxx-COOH system tetratricopeptide repeat protein [Kitasatospora purpeofusca]|uniref:FxSxx-COOH system tetratricopeptide repeat protein n=1 Tax=Kitasatospora purpeofusca TaxID=67352 RepID=UPI002A5A8311|nr:FxSxx-COOH system tetratricopeptide repeat protein [Kitasatospora purpeofusca]MDY0809807.1 FxSxx-COOH system tetratricopeptide repeat protein [Kitasatospora purpeofusca]
MSLEHAALADHGSAALATPGTGTVVTFYSFKGGTGRTMALANLGWILASQGLRVLVVDWDLEAPGLHRYYHPLLVDPELHGTDGLIDMLRAYVDEALPGPDRRGPGPDPREWLSVPGRLEQYLCGLALDLPDGGKLDLMPAGRQNAAYSAAVTSFNWRSFYTRADIRGAEFLYALREQWTRSYDYVLIDSRTGVSDTSGICTVLMPDTVVDCFTLGAQSIRGGVDAARAIVDADEREIRVLPVPMRVEDAERAGLAAGRDLAHDAFDPYLERWLSPERRADYWRDVEVPYKPFYAYEEVPATIVDRPQQGRSLLAAFERLAAWLTDGRVSALRPLPDLARRRLYAAYLRTGRTRSRQVHVSYAPKDRVWAEWISETLRGFGYLVSLHSAAVPLEPGPAHGAALPEAAGPLDGDGRLLALLTPEYTALPRAREIWRRLTGQGPVGDSGGLLAVRLGGAEGMEPPQFAGHRALDLALGSAEQAEAQLFELIGPAPGAGRWMETGGVGGTGGTGETAVPHPARFPDGRPSLQELPPRLPTFTGRMRLLEAVRDGFTADSAAAPVQVLYGIGGVGKSQAAIEYAHRFAAGYDVLWWVPAQQPAVIPQKLAELAPGLGLETDGDVTRTARAVLDALASGRPYHRWLLLFDNAEDPELLDPWLPAAGPGGHVLVTSRDRRWARRPGRTEVEVFDRAESVELVRHFNTGVERADAERIAELLGDLPLAVGQAAAWLQETPMPAATYADLLDETLTDILDRSVRGAPVAVAAEEETGGQDVTAEGATVTATAATWRIAGSDLRRINAPAARLLEVCGFLGPEAIPISLLYSPPVIEAIGLAPDTSDQRLAVGEILRTVNQFNLARYDHTAGTLVVHRIVQALLREQVGEADRVRVRGAAHRALALADPGDPDAPHNWLRYAELLPHLWPSGAVDSTDPAIRQWIVNSVRYLWQRSLHDAGRELAERVLARWREAGPQGVEADVKVQLLRVQLGNIQRTQGLVREAYETDRDAFERLTDLRGREHRDTFPAATSLGGDLRHLGRYREARELDEGTMAAARRVLGADHPRTLMAENNLAVSIMLTGDFAEALAIHEGLYLRKLEVFGKRSPYTILGGVVYGHVLGEVGRLDEALDRLDKAVRRSRQVLGEEHDETMRARRYRSVVLRRLGRLPTALADAEDVYQRLVERYGPDHPGAASAAASLASVLGVLGDTGRAVELAEEAYLYHRDHLGAGHPAERVAAGNLAVALRRAGQIAEAEALSGKVLDDLWVALGERHPYVGVARLNRANDLARTGRYAEALSQAEAAATLLTERFGPDHPDALAASANVVLALTAVGETARAAELRVRTLFRARALPYLVGGHPLAEAIRVGEWLEVETEMPLV